MRAIAVSLMLCALTQTAIAQSPECRTLPDSNARLSCYDKTYPPMVMQNAAPAVLQNAAPARKTSSKVDSSGYVDKLTAEDSRVNSRLKNICRGC